MDRAARRGRRARDLRPDQVATYFAAATAGRARARRVPRALPRPLDAGQRLVGLVRPRRQPVLRPARRAARPTDFIMRNAMDAQEVAVGWWPGDERYGQAAFYAYAHPAPHGFADARRFAAGRALGRRRSASTCSTATTCRAGADPRGARSSSRARRSSTPAPSATGTRRCRRAPPGRRRRSPETAGPGELAPTLTIAPRPQA